MALVERVSLVHPGRTTRGEVLMGRERVPYNGAYTSDAELPNLPPKPQGGNWGPPPWRWRTLG
jgi:hypothetical protein